MYGTIKEMRSGPCMERERKFAMGPCTVYSLRGGTYDEAANGTRKTGRGGVVHRLRG